MLSASGLQVNYGRIKALRGTTVYVGEGEIVGVVGHNGVGKSTLLRAIVGLVPLEAGTVEFEGRVLSRDPAAAVRRGIAYVPEDRRIFATLTVEENLRVAATAARTGGVEDIDRELDRFPVIREMTSRRAGDLSGGQQQMLTIARALVSRPRLVLLDEPTLGLGPIIVEQIFERLAELRDEGVTLLLVEQNVAKTIELADRTYVLGVGGRCEFEGPSEALQAQADFRDRYLRVSSEARAE